MNVEQFSNEFDTLVNAYARSIPFGEDASPIDIRVDEYEKSLFLTKAQKELVIDYYSGQNAYNLSFEEKEIIREALDTLVKTITPEPVENVSEHIMDNKQKTFYRLPADLLYIIFEEVKFSSYLSGCKGGYTALVVPSTHDEVWHRLQNPFRGPNNKRVLRLNAENNLVELISDYPIGSYLLRCISDFLVTVFPLKVFRQRLNVYFLQSCITRFLMLRLGWHFNQSQYLLVPQVSLNL